MKAYIFSFFLSLFLLPFSSKAQDVYMEIRGATQGNITTGASTSDSAGDFWQSGHEGESLVFAMEVTTKNLIDENSGTLSGDPIPCVLQVKKLVDSASPLLFQSLLAKENLQVTLRFWRNNNSVDEHYYTLRFTGVQIATIRLLSQEEDTSTIPVTSTEFEEVSFIYTNVEAIHEISGSASSWNFNN